MKFRLTNYDTSAYKLLERKLNKLSNQGYNSPNIDKFSFFKEDCKLFHYKTDIFIYDKKNNLNKSQQYNNWLTNYTKKGYEFVGKTNKIHVFKAKKEATTKSTDSSLLINYFKKRKRLLNILFIIISLFLSLILIPPVFVSNSPENFITNGSVLIHFAPLVLCISLIIRFSNNFFQTETTRSALTKKTASSYNNIYESLFIISNWLFILFIIMVISGFILDSTQRQNVNLNKEFVSLQDLNYTPATDFECIKSSSILIDKTYNYFETNNRQNLKASYYYFSSQQKACDYLNNYLNNHNYLHKQQINNGYLLSDDETYRNLIFTKDNVLIVIKTNFDLKTDNLYQQIIN